MIRYLVQTFLGSQEILKHKMTVMTLVCEMVIAAVKKKRIKKASKDNITMTILHIFDFEEN